MEQRMPGHYWDWLTTGLFFMGMGLWVVLWVLSRQGISVAGWRARATEKDAVRLGFAFVVPIWIVAGAGHYVVLAKTGGWTPGDWRASDQFVAIMVFFMVVVAPAISVVALISLWRAHRPRP
jgi:hypothetical protein